MTGDIAVLQRRVRELAKERNAVILTHNYQRKEIQEIGDHGGDSLGLSRKAAQTEADIILFCGVRFMAETAAVLCPDKTVLMPDLEAGCPLADMITVDQLERKKARYPDATVVTYVNTTADVKAHSDVCCTSSNAVEIVNGLDAQQVLFVPDRNLGLWVQKHTNKEIILWDGYCHVHIDIKREEILAAKEQYPDAPLIAHPECNPDVLELADEVCSTGGMIPFAKRTAAKVILVGTELGMRHPLEAACPDKTLVFPSRNAYCHNMKRHTVPKMIAALENVAPVVSIPEEVRAGALRSLQAMEEIMSMTGKR